jgi:hypothetical protein
MKRLKIRKLPLNADPQHWSFPMRPQRTQRMSSPAPPMHRAALDLPKTGYVLIVDGQAKKEFETQNRALKTVRELKNRFPRLQVKVYDAEAKQSQNVDLDPLAQQ